MEERLTYLPRDLFIVRVQLFLLLVREVAIRALGLKLRLKSVLGVDVLENGAERWEHRLKGHQRRG